MEPNEKKIEYKILWASAWGLMPVQDLEQQVNKAISEGWLPHGNPTHAVQNGWGARGQHMTQAIIREISE